MPESGVSITEQLRSGLAEAGLRWSSADWVGSTGSTNRDLAERFRDGQLEESVLVSDHQSEGRGRLDRSWQAPPGTSVAISTLVRPERDLRDWSWLPLVAGVSVCLGLQRSCAAEPGRFTVKWPNDVLLDERKVCGILMTRVESGSNAAAVIGMGVNLTMTREQLPVPTATSLSLAGLGLGAVQVVVAVLAALEENMGKWEATGELRSAYRQHCDTIGREVRVSLNEHSVVDGVAEDVDELGRLLVRTASGRRAFAAGDVQHLRRVAGPGSWISPLIER